MKLVFGLMSHEIIFDMDMDDTAWDKEINVVKKNNVI